MPAKALSAPSPPRSNARMRRSAPTVRGRPRRPNLPAPCFSIRSFKPHHTARAILRRAPGLAEQRQRQIVIAYQRRLIAAGFGSGIAQYGVDGGRRVGGLVGLLDA